MFFSFSDRREALEKEGVYIGGWSLRYFLTPRKLDGKHDSSEDRVANATVATPDWTLKEERALVRKLDLRVLLPCCIIYYLAYLDRGNIGTIKVLGAGTPHSLEKSLGLVGTDYNWAVSITYFAVTAFLMPANIAMKKVSAKYFFPVVMVGFGICSMSLASVRNTSGLLAGRFFLGIPEAGVVPACVMYFSMWYKPSERALRVAIFHSANAAALASASFITEGVGHLQGSYGLNAWQWVFIIDGALPIAMSVPIFFLLLTFPETSSALSDRERFIAINRFGRGSSRHTDVTWSWPAFIRIFKRPSTYVFFVAYVSLCICAVAQSTFLATILNVFLKFPTSKAILYTAIVPLAMMPLYWIWGFHSDWTRERMWHFLIPVMGTIPCYATWTYVSTHPEANGTTISTMAMYGLSFLGQLLVIAQPVVLTYRSATLYGAAEQAVGGAAAVASLSIGSIIGPQMYPNKDAPLYVGGFAGTCVVLAISILSYASLPWWLEREARIRKNKTGHATPLQAMQDAENSQVSEAARARLHEINAAEEAETLKSAMQKKQEIQSTEVHHVEELEERK